MKNPKLQFDKEQKKWFVIDAPEMPNKFGYEDGPREPGIEPYLNPEYYDAMEAHQEALSKAPRWEVKNQEEIKRLLWNAIVMDMQSHVPVRFKDWEPDPTKLYDLPKGWKVEIKAFCQACHNTQMMNCAHFDTCGSWKELAILIPEEEVNLELNLFQELKNTCISTFSKHGNNKALLLKGRRSFTGNEIANEIEKESKLGIEMVDNLLKLTIDLLMRDKINQGEVKETESQEKLWDELILILSTPDEALINLKKALSEFTINRRK